MWELLKRCCILLVTTSNRTLYCPHRGSVATLVMSNWPFSVFVSHFLHSNSAVSTLLQNIPSAAKMVNVLRELTRVKWSVGACQDAQHCLCSRCLRRLALLCTGSHQHHVRFWRPDPEVPGSQQVDLPGGVRRQGSGVDRGPSRTGGSARSGTGSASGTKTRLPTIDFWLCNLITTLFYDKWPITLFQKKKK